MVKILQAYNFAKQQTFSLNGEILAATLIDSNRIAISSAEQFIEIHDIGGKQRSSGDDVLNPAAGGDASESAATANSDERLPAKYSLATVGEVVNLIYCEAGKYLLTLEKESAGSPVHAQSSSISCTSSSNSGSGTIAGAYADDETKLFVRIYANFWKFSEAKLIDVPITIRIASMTTPKAPLVESMDVIELPLRSAPDLIQCCQTSGNIIVSSKERIYLYEYAQCSHECTQPRFSYIDFLPFKFFVNLNFVPLQMNLTENVIACMNNRYCVAFKVVDVLGGGAGSQQRFGGVGDDDNDVEEAAAAAVSSTESSSIVSKASAGPSSHNSFETDSLETTTSGGGGGGHRLAGVAGFPGRTPIDFNVARMVNSACGREFEVELKSQWEQGQGVGGGVDSCSGSGAAGAGYTGGGLGDSQEIIIMPTRASEIKIKLVNEAKAMNVQRISSQGNAMSSIYNDDNSVQYDIRKLLQICMRTSSEPAAPNGRIVDILRCMDLKAIYQRSNVDTSGGDDDCDADAEDEAQYELGNNQKQLPGAAGGFYPMTTSKPATQRRTLKSSRHRNCIGYALLVASSVDGYLYQFCAQGKWYSDNEKPIATYAFTAPVLRVHINDYVIYAVTTESVETHTSRVGHKLFNNRFEYPSLGRELFAGGTGDEAVVSAVEACSADVNTAIAVIGLCSFVHVQYVCVTRDNLILISNGALGQSTSSAAVADAAAAKRRSGGGVEIKRNIAARLLAELRNGSGASSSASQHSTAAVALNEWTLYSLQLPPVEHVVDDLEAVAVTYRAASSSDFYDLMEEAHVMLCLSLALQCEKLSVARERHLRARFMENCRKLADFSIRSKKKEVYLQASAFYKMCNLQLSDIYSNYIESFEQSGESQQQHVAQKTPNAHNIRLQHNPHAIDPQALVGLIYTVKHFLLGLGTDRLRAAFLNQLVKPFFTPLRVIEQGYPQVPLSLEFLNMFIKYSAADIPQIMLNSPVVADAISGELINYLKYLETLNAEQSLLLAVTACRMSNYLLAQEIIAAKKSRRDLATSLIKYKNVLFDDGTVLNQKQQQHSSNKCNTQPSGPLKQHQPRHQQKRQQSSLAPVATGSRRQSQQSHSASSTVVSFSDFTETILLATENAELIEAISDAFIHALCIEHSISLDMVLQLFLNYIASHIGHKGYQTSQKVFVNILQVYYYDHFDVSPLHNAHDLRSSNSPPHIDDDDYDVDDDDDGDETSSKAHSLNSERDNESIANSMGGGGDSNSGASSSLEEERRGQRHNRIVYDQLQEQQASPFKHHSNDAAANAYLNQQQQLQEEQNYSDGQVQLKGLKILFRMYLGRLKVLCDLLTDLQPADVEQQRATSADFLSLRLECIKFMQRHLQEMRQQQQQQQQQQLRNGVGSHHYSTQYYYAKTSYNASARAAAAERAVFVPFVPDYKLATTAASDESNFAQYIRPIPCLLERPSYLNHLPPFRRSDFSVPQRDEGECEVRFLGWHNEMLTLTLKIQSLLASPKIDRDIIEEFIAFIQKSPNLHGIDSFLVIILPKNLAINYMLNFCPEYLWQYGKSNYFTPKHWESLLRKIISKQDLLPNWKSHITEILNNLVSELSFEELLQCFPSEVIQNRNTELFLKEFADNRIVYEKRENRIFDREETKTNQTDNADAINSKLPPRDHLPMDNIDENNVFELTLRKAVAKQRSIALRSMIESTGTQLFDATSNPMYNL